MGGNWLGVLLVLAVAGALIGISYLHKRRAQPYVDRFAQTYCETVAHVLGDDEDAYRDVPQGAVETEDREQRAPPHE